MQTTPITQSEEIQVLLSEITAATTNNQLKIESVNGQPKTYLIVLP